MARACDLLECSSVLEAKLLPKLDFRSQLILASTCHGLRDWLHKLPVANWQASPLSPVWCADTPVDL